MKLMKNLFLFIAILGLSHYSFGAKWRVNNNAGVSADFTSVQLAHDGATAGDTIYVEGSAVAYSSFTLSKSLYIFGPGYFLTENDTTQANLSPATISGTCYIDAGDVVLSGLTFTGRVDVRASNVTIKRNRFTYQGIEIYNNAGNVMVIQNHMRNGFASSSYAPVKVSTGSTNIFVHNNYLEGYSLSYNSLIVSGTSSASITNNVINGNIDIVNSTMTNNIQNQGTLTATSCNFFNNIGNSTQYGTANGNQENVNMLTVFDSTQTTTDSQWKLIAGSPALGAGQSGEDCGMFGGLDPYKLSGIPALPAIFFFSSPSSGSAGTGLPVNIKVKAHK